MGSVRSCVSGLAYLVCLACPLTCLSLLHPLSGLCVCPCGVVLYCVSTVLQAAGEARLRDPEYASWCVVCAQREHKGSIQLVGAQ